MGLKEATGEIGRIHELVAGCAPAFTILSGEDHLGLETILAGGEGVISVTANVAPGPMHEMCRAALAGDADEARRIDARLRDLHAALFVESNPIPAKWALYDRGLIGEGIRLPLTRLSASFHDRVRRAALAAEAVPA